MFEMEADERGRACLVEVVAEQNLSPAVRRIAKERGLISYTEDL
jgi:hypothetical protein